MKTISILAIAAALGFSLASGAQAQEYAATAAPTSEAASANSPLNIFSALSQGRTYRIDRQQNSEAWQGAGIGGNPNGN